jgi:predicted nuclease of restriction endonuclease-like (RecB) superfamily
MELQNHFNKIAKLIQDARNKALSIVNRELIELYWKVGEYICQQIEGEGWGKSTVKSLSEYLNKEYPNIKGFSSQNIWRMKQFFECYRDNEKLSALLREISWTNNIMILSKSKTVEEKEFYLRLCIKERYSSRELERQIDSGYFERYMLTDKKASFTIKEKYSKAPKIFRDSYVLEFLNLPDKHLEKDLQKAIIYNLKKFILEFGKDFIFIGEEYKIQVGNSDFYIDLLFYHRELSCLVALELKIDNFKPEYLGKLNFYLEALDRDVKKPHENPSVGIILCKSKDNDIVEYALSRNLSSALVAEYTTKLIDKKLLQQKLHELFELSEEQIEIKKEGEGI